MSRPRTLPTGPAERRLARALAAYRKANEEVDAAGAELLRRGVLALADRHPELTEVEWVVEWEYDDGDYFLSARAQVPGDPDAAELDEQLLDLRPGPDAVRLIGSTVGAAVPEYGDFRFTVSVEKLREVAW